MLSQVQLRALHPHSSCSESPEWVRLEQGFCLSSLDKVCLLLPFIPTLMAPCHHYSPSTPWHREWNFQAEVIGGSRAWRMFLAPATLLQSISYLIYARGSLWSALNNATIALQPLVSTTFLLCCGTENTFAQAFIAFSLPFPWNADFFPLPNTLDTESHPVKA